jgi:hypothetical protein
MTTAPPTNNLPKPPDTPIFLVRPDRIGDAVLTTPAFQLVHDFFEPQDTKVLLLAVHRGLQGVGRLGSNSWVWL